MINGFSKKELYLLAWEKPSLAQIEITGNCNQSCLHCFRGHSDSIVVEDMPLESWRMIIEKLYGIGVRRLDFTGSESFMHSEFVNILEFAKAKGFNIRVNTNGINDVEDIVDLVDEIVFSIHGLNDIHDMITRTPGSFSMADANIALASREAVKVSINMSLFKSNYHQMLQVFDYFYSRYCINSFSPTIPVPSLFGNDFSEGSLDIDSRLISDYIGKLSMIPKEKIVLKHGFHSIFINDEEYYRRGGFPLPNCAAGKYKLIVDYDGSVYPCNFFRSDDFYCGNMLINDAADIWRDGNGFNIFRRLILDERTTDKCRGCLKKYRCFSGCRAWSENYRKGGFYESGDLRCELGFAFIGSGNNH